jgi:glucosamine-6-phosphate deaminase
MHNSTAHTVPGTHIQCCVFESSDRACRHAARMIANLVRQRGDSRRKAVLGLATGSTVLGVYRELIRLHREEMLDFSHVETFNLDEYYGLSPDRLQSHHRWMFTQFFEHVNVPRDAIHVLDGTVTADRVEEHSRQFEDAIRKAGGIDLQLLGIGRNGRIGFNEPFSVPNSRTRLVTLDPVTRKEAASDFLSEDNVPTHALSMGIGTILDARAVVLMAFGEHKATIVRETTEGPLTDRVPASLLRNHPHVSFFLDPAAAAEMTSVAAPWLQGNVEWTEPLIKRAVLWLCQETKKALLKLDDNDFRNHNLHQLLRHHGPASKLAHRVFRWMMATIEYHPGGREPRRVLCFSPHPDDDVISMGGTMLRLADDQHDLHVAYMTSGNIAVHDHDVQQLADLMTELNRRFEIDVSKTPGLEKRVLAALAEKRPGQPDSDDVLKFKALIRWSEAKAAAVACGCREENLHFLDLPFYRTGTIDKNPPGPDDIRVVQEYLRRIKPHQVYVAGDLTDPHGTHRVCAWIIFQAIKQLQDADPQPEVLLYRGAWQEWPLYAIEIAVPLSPRDVDKKRLAIFRHESQKDTALFPGPDDRREFWQRAEDRNRHTADLFDEIGLPEYYALEAFVRWDGRES